MEKINEQEIECKKCHKIYLADGFKNHSNDYCDDCYCDLFPNN